MDDHPENNISIVRTVLSTSAVLDHVQRADYGLIITDLGRSEGGTEHTMAGRELIEQLRQRGDATPVIVFAGSRGKENEVELKSAGAYLVRNAPPRIPRKPSGVRGRLVVSVA